MTDINCFFNGTLEDQVNYLHENCPGHVCSDLIELLYVWRKFKKDKRKDHPLKPELSISPFGYVVYGNPILEHRFQWGFTDWKEVGSLFGRVDIVETLVAYIEGDLKLNPKEEDEVYLRTLLQELNNMKNNNLGGGGRVR